MIYIEADKLQDGLYQIQDGQIHKYKAKGGTVRTYEMGEIRQEDFATLCICAIRYCHGRKTYMPSLVMEIVGRHLSELSDRDIKVMYDDCRFMNQSDYGDEIIDKPNWLLWEKTLRKEMERRGGDVA